MSPPRILARLLVLVALVLPSRLPGDVRSSATYTVEAETFDGGGGRSASVKYGNEGSFEPLVAGKSISSKYTILHGFISALTIASLHDYNNWALARGLTAGVNDGFFDDPNLDGMPNLNHFAFDSDPLGQASEECKRRVGSVSILNFEFLSLTLPIRKGAVFNGGLPLLSHTIDDVHYQILGDYELTPPWVLRVVEQVPAQDAGLPALGDYDAVPGADWEYRTFRLTQPLSAASSYFLKAGVTVVP